MNKRQQMRWSPAGAHQLLQVRAAALNGTLDLDRLDKRQSIATANDNCGLRLAA